MKRKVLMCLSSLSQTNGIAMFIMNQYNSLINNGFDVDFLLMKENISTHKYLDEIIKRKGNIYCVPKHNKFNRYQIVSKYLQNILNENFYDIVHINLVDVYAVACIKQSKKFKVKNVIYHIHNPKYKSKLGYISNIINNVCIKYSDYLVACSKVAGKSMFKKHQFDILENKINIKRMKFDFENRMEIRKKLKIENKIVLGTVGRLTNQKNPFFVMDILNEIKKNNPDVCLIWAGGGNLEKEIKAYVKKLKIEENVIFLGNIDNVEKVYSAMDIFLLPSKFEGLGIVFIESQANGLITFASDKVPSNINKTDLVTFVSIEKDANYWANKILKKIEEIEQNNLCREKYNEILSGTEFSIDNDEDGLLQYYYGVLNKDEQEEIC